MSEQVINVKGDQELSDRMLEVEKTVREGEEISEMVTPPESIMFNVKLQSKDRRKQVECRVCLHIMRSDHLKRHMLQHRELHTLDVDEIREEIKRRKKLREIREDQRQLVRRIAEEEGLPLEYCDIETPDYLNPISIEKEMMHDDQIYTRKIEKIGKIITNMLENGSVREASLSKDNTQTL